VKAPAEQPDIADESCSGEVTERKLLAAGFCRYERISFASATQARIIQTRDILRAGRAAAVLPIDLARRQIVLLRQFRLAAQVASGNGNLVEIVAGRVDPEEEPAEAARRECLEEIGLVPKALTELFTYFPSPGISDEQITLFIGIVDSSTVPRQGGLAAEHEIISPMPVSIEAALAALNQGRVHNGPLIIALQWLALNRERLAEIVAQQ
jgi:ADP-ribose pyrophosphatase